MASPRDGTLRAWVREAAATAAEPERPWRRTEAVRAAFDVEVSDGGSVVAGAAGLTSALAGVVGADGLSAEIRVDVETWGGTREIVVQLVNTSPESHPMLKDTHLYETVLEIEGVETVPFELEQLPDAFRYDRKVPAYGINVGVESDAGRFRTTDTVAVTTRRPAYWNSPHAEPDLTFVALSSDPLPPLRELVEALGDYNDLHWSTDRLDARAAQEGWDDGLREQAARAADDVRAEQARLQAGLALLRDDDTVRQAFALMNTAIGYSSEGRGYDRWRPFQIGFLLQALPFLTAGPAHADVVDTAWFATGGGKTETYLGLLVTAALHDRMTGKSSGVTAWSRFPLRLLVAPTDAAVRRRARGCGTGAARGGHPGRTVQPRFLVGARGTPNKVVKEATDGHPDPDSEGMPDRYQVLMHCPFCRSDKISMRFDRRFWRLVHELRERALPVAGEVPPVLRR